MLWLTMIDLTWCFLHRHHPVTEQKPRRLTRGVGYVLIVPCMNHPVLQEDIFIVYFQLVTDPKL